MAETNKKIQATWSFRQEIRLKTADYILASFGFVTGLAWNEAIKSLIEQLFPLHSTGSVAKLVYALFITVVFVIISTSVMRTLKKEA